jgi:hypothetical protein
MESSIAYQASLQLAQSPLVFVFVTFGGFVPRTGLRVCFTSACVLLELVKLYCLDRFVIVELTSDIGRHTWLP